MLVKGNYQQVSPATLAGIISGTPFTQRGFTDHEHLDAAQLIHMNGRVYDYNLGRFLSVDPIIQSPGNSQSLNPYSYIMNNPLAGTDPTGYTSCDADSPKECADVASTLDEGEVANITQSETGSRIKRKIGTITGNGNDTVKVNIGKNLAVVDIGGQKEQAKSNISTSQSGLSGAFNEVANFGDWLVNHANDQLSQDESWRGGVWNFFAEDGINAFNQLSDGELMAGATSLGMALLKPLKAGDKLVDSYYNLQKAGRKDAHHIIQDAAARDLPTYRKADGPSVQLRGPSTNKGSPHYIATQVQRQRGGGTYASERRIGYKALRKSGMSKTDARTAISEADKYFQSIGVTPSTIMRIPGNRR